MVQVNVMEANSGRLTAQSFRVSTCIAGVIPMWFCFQEAHRVEKYFYLTFWRRQEASWGKDRRGPLSYWASICQTKIFTFYFFAFFFPWPGTGTGQHAGR